ncbi:MAG: sigma-70 family RNA polymerase sigma factor [Gemmataceae bacterium]
MNSLDDASTRSSLVNGLRDTGDHTAWLRFRDRYLARLRATCATLGVRPDALDDVVGDVLAGVAKAMRDGWAYDPANRFRGWLYTLCRNAAVSYHRREGRSVKSGGVGSGDSRVLSALQNLPCPEADEVGAEWSETVRAAAERVRVASDPKQWLCFARNGVEQVPAGKVATELAVTPEYVWQMKSRIAKRIRAEVQRMLDEGTGSREAT